LKLPEEFILFSVPRANKLVSTFFTLWFLASVKLVLQC
jgi:hypothetical protein